MSNLETIPCKQCLVLAICRNKPFDTMLKDCHHMLRLLYFINTDKPGNRAKNFNELITSMEEHLKPTSWYTEITDDGFANINIKEINDETNPM